ncbi:tumor necrosis factor receptor superfamily member 14-like isoform X4 [Gymnodraco acuticeps]|uniref:Tumor necrosis factor receptor superfamily member 14-like isoform X4 n=1 Tax=Gymnodraco acuticeps TaxID=8218 RepID=A0A6P8TKI5_GYMAC|nr:tumor necrosis factor receptor superfamily member 14-like isoform X4 [Gymnodraco acuticeps]
MLAVFVVLGCVSFLAQGLCCRPKEYSTRAEQCCPMCSEGTIVQRDCTSHSGTRCSRCKNGTFMNHPNGLDKCFTCTSCDSGAQEPRQR